MRLQLSGLLVFQREWNRKTSSYQMVCRVEVLGGVGFCLWVIIENQWASHPDAYAERAVGGSSC